MYSLGYIVDVQICVAALYLVYITLLHRHISYGIARLYLILMLPVGLLIPLLNLPLLPAAKTVVQSMVENVPEVAFSEKLVVENVSSFNYYHLVYLIGFGIMLLWMLVGFVKLYIQFRHSRIERIGKYKVVFVKQESYAYTILNCIFINKKFRDTPMLSELIAHETEHIKLGHTYDLIYVSIMRMIFWFNPIVWHILHLLRQMHEYQVDKSVIEKGYSLRNYVNLLIMSEAGISPEFTTPFGYSFTKKRIAMLLKKNQTNNRGRLLVTIPVLASLLFAFSVTSRAAIEYSVEDIKPDTVLHSFPKQPKDYMKFIAEHVESDSPLIVIDGVISSDEALKKIDVNKIQTVTVLKDKTARDIYGEAGKNGVIVVEIKRDEVIVEGITAKVSSVDLSYKGQLFIVDGFVTQYEACMKLSMDIIKSFTVLDGVTGEKIYGSKGVNGVVIVETTRDKPTFFITGTKRATFTSDGLIDFKEWVMKRIKYPQESIKNNSKGSVTAEFYVEKDGKVSDVKIIEGTDKRLNDEVFRVVKSSPVWDPAIENGISVRSKQNVKVVFVM